MGGDFQKIRLSLQEYFEKLGKDPVKWGKPFSALLGAFYVQKSLGIPAIGGKDSMSGTFKDLHVPPTLVAFAVDVLDVRHVVSPEFKKPGSEVVLLPLVKDEDELPNFVYLTKTYAAVHKLMQDRQVLAASVIKQGGLAAAVTKMSFGYKLGIELDRELCAEDLFRPHHGSLVLELAEGVNTETVFAEVPHLIIGKTLKQPAIVYGKAQMDIDTLYQHWEKPLEKVFPTKTELVKEPPQYPVFTRRNSGKPKTTVAKPRVFMPVFPGTNCEYDTARAFTQAGGIVDTMVVRNLTTTDVEHTIEQLAKRIKAAQIVMLPGGFSAGDEPDGSGKFIATMFRNPRVKEAVMDLLRHRDGLMLGICNGFQALIKLGLVPYGEIIDITEDCPTLTYNKIGRHVSSMIQTKVVSTLSPWFSQAEAGDIHTVAISHGEGRFVASEQLIAQLMERGQVATQYVDLSGNPSNDIRYNANGSMDAIEGISSPDGRVLGKMGHSERIGTQVAVNIPGNKDQRIFASGINYFR
jgi:phosphoribosylformylglycinamidine synthase